MSIEEHLARKDKYRVVANDVPFAHPIYKTTPDPSLSALVDELEHEVTGLLSSFKITVQNILLRLWRAYPGREAIANVCHITTFDTDPVAWQAATKSVYSLVLSRGASNLNLEHPFQVEISNPDLSYHDISRCLPNDPPLLSLLEGAKDKITEIVSTELSGVGSAISFHSRVPHYKRFIECIGKPTVIVYCRPGIPADFDSAEDQLIRLFQEATVDVHIELLPGAVGDSATVDLGMPISFPHIPRTPVHGSSISPEGEEGAGSLGGWVQLNLPGRHPQKCMLTCYRAVRAVDPEIASVTDRDGVTAESNSGHVRIVYPAEMDKSCTMQLFEKEKLEGRSESIKEFEDTWKAVLQTRSIGQVLFASGNRLYGRHRVDWALVDGSETFSSNRPPSRSEIVPIQRPNQMAIWGPNDDFQAREFGVVGHGDWVAFRGRTSGIASGEVNRIKSRLFWPAIKLTSDEWEVLPLGAASFNLPGDSGSMVFNSSGQIVGLNMTKIGEAGWILTMETIQRDIKERMGGSLSLEYDLVNAVGTWLD